MNLHNRTHGKSMKPSVAVVILNYNNWQDTIACVESVLRSEDRPEQVILVDNASGNDSVRWFRHWAAGHLEFLLPEWGIAAPVLKPLALQELSPEQAKENPDAERLQPAGAPRLVLIKNAVNRGYAAGNNAGIRHALAHGADAVWILNNDTVVDAHALGAMRDALFAKARPGLCGSLIRYAEARETVQCRAGGRTNKWTGLSVLNGNRLPVSLARKETPENVEKGINFIYGASVMASKAFLTDVGLLDERFFLYSEEQDWAYRAQGKFDFAYAPNAHVFHKEGGSTGWSGRKLSTAALLHITRSRLLLAFKHTPYAVPTVVLSLIYAALRLLWRRIGCRHPSEVSINSAI